MAANISIWPGSSSFFSGDTPFGLYDSDTQFQSDAEKVSNWCAKRMGYPINDIELQATNFFACFEEAVSEYGSQLNTYNIRDNMLNLYGAQTGSNLTGKKISPNFGGLIELAEEYGVEAGSGGNVTYYTGSISVTKNQQIYDLTDANIVSLENGIPGTNAIEIKTLFHEAPPAIVKYFDPMVGTGLGSQQMMESFGFGGMSPGVSFMMMPLYADMLRLQAIEFNNQIRRSSYSFEVANNRVKFFPIPNGTNFTKVYFKYILKSDRSNPLKENIGAISDFSNAPYDNVIYKNVNDVGKQWIRKYALALAKEMLGFVRGKYSAIPIPNAEVTLNGSDLLSAGQAEKEALITELKDTLDTMSRQSQLERKQAESDALLQQMNKIPLKIYIG
tara:strand:- start:3556 stop:4719 length:1164 start_codon:yes stop_codon:yes gene_type:complete